jgi:hypothetical protein
VYAAAAPGYVSFSTNGHHWQTHEVKELSSIRGIAIGPAGTVVVGEALYRDAAEAVYSADRTNWTKLTLPFPDRAWEMAFFKDRFVMAGDAGLLAHSTNGFAWERQKTGDSPHISAVAYGKGRIVALGVDHRSRPRELWSTNGIEWSKVELPGSNALVSVTFANGKFVAVGWNGQTTVSEDGVSWSGREHESERDLFDVTHSPLGFVAAGRAIVMRSADGVEWERTGHPPIVLYDIAYGNGVFLVSGSSMGAETMRSTDLWEWDRLSGPPGRAHKVEFGNGRFVAPTFDGVYVSPDGTNWIRGDPITLWDLTFSEGLFCGSSGRDVLVSTDGLRWHRFGAPMGVRAGRFMGRIFGFGVNGTVLEANDTGSIGIRSASGKVVIDGVRLNRGTFRYQKSSNLRDWLEVSADERELEMTRAEDTRSFFRLILPRE